MSISRTTTRSIPIDSGPAHALRLPKTYSASGAQFRVTSVEETVRQNSSTHGDQQTSTYLLVARGPVQTSKGRDHGSQSGSRAWSGTDLKDGAVPPAIAELTWGPTELAAWVQ